MAHLNWKGSMIATSVLNFQIHEENILPFENLCGMTYEKIIFFSQVLEKDTYVLLMKNIFKASVEKIRRKSQIKISFVLYDASMWCGDKLYNFFAQNERYEVTIFLCLRTDRHDNERVTKDFWHGVEQFKAKGLNVVAISEFNQQIPRQDLIIYLTPYLGALSKAFRSSNITAETLITYIPYGIAIDKWDISDYEILKMAWKFFFDTKTAMEFSENHDPLGLARGHLSGYPRMDVFFDADSN